MQRCRTIQFLFANLNLVALILSRHSVFCEVFLLGYITGSQRKPGDESYSRPGLSISGAISLAVHEINTVNRLVENHTIDFVVAETYGDESESIKETSRLWMEGKVYAYIGPQETCVHEARMASSFNLPMISYFCAHPETSNKQLFTTFARTRPPDTQISKSVASVLLKFKWYKIALLYSQSETSFRNFEAVAKTIESTLLLHKIDVVLKERWTSTYHYGFTANPFRDIVLNSFSKTRIYVIVGHYFEHLGFMLSLQERGLLDDGNYFVVGVDVEQYDISQAQRYFKGLLHGEVEEVADIAFKYYIGVVSSPHFNSEAFAFKVNKYMLNSPFNYENPIGTNGHMRRIPVEGAYLYDAVYVYARALNDSLVNNRNPKDGKSILDFIKGRPYKSAMGYMVYMDENGDAEGNYTLIARKRNPVTNESGLFPVGIFQMTLNATNLPTLNLFDSIEWVNGMCPLDEPVCGFDGKKCPGTQRIFSVHRFNAYCIARSVKWLLVLISTSTFIISLLLTLAYRSWLYERELDSLLWRIDFKDVAVCDVFANDKLSKMRYCSQISLSSENDQKEFRYCNIHTQIAIFKGRFVAIKRINKKHVEVNRKLKKEMKIMKDMRHDNINQFIGACIDSPNVCLLSDYCVRGSLRDVLENEQVHLDLIFVASMVADILRGMIYIHDSNINYHGNLKSSNCLIDSRWIVKITDFGLWELKIEPIVNQSNIEIHCEKLLWKAPELLRDLSIHGTQKGDVYSFGIILFEILGRCGPWGTLTLPASEIVKLVASGNIEKPFRPSLDILQSRDNMNSKNYDLWPIPDCCIQCIILCWSENPEERLDFKSLRTKLRPIRKGLKSNILDNMLQVMERYTNNLEALVDERTDQLFEEKKKTEALLYEMLPKTVADNLKRGYKVEAESFDAVTIYFSDVVGFTQLSAESTPLQIVDFLNDLYTLFDSILESYDVYKVETIGDAYMVVSGLPIKNDNLHAAQIASMALHVLHAVNQFKIKHLSHRKLMIRIGIHTGPVCAGIVGLKMPRYCLFGDTVNTASRMETTGLPLKIHCSEQFVSVLKSFNRFETIERGFVDIKGKGKMKTFWLLNEMQTKLEVTNISSIQIFETKTKEHFANSSPQKIRSNSYSRKTMKCLPFLYRKSFSKNGFENSSKSIFPESNELFNRNIDERNTLSAISVFSVPSFSCSDVHEKVLRSESVPFLMQIPY